MSIDLEFRSVVDQAIAGIKKFENAVDKVHEPVESLNRTLRKLGDIKDTALKPVEFGMKMVQGAANFATAEIQLFDQALNFAADEAEKLGRVDVSTNIENARNSLEGLGDVLVSVDFYGRDFLQWMGDFAVGLDNSAKVVGAFVIQQQLLTGVIDQATAEQMVYNLVTDETAVAAEEAKSKTEAQTTATLAQKQAAEDAAKANKDFNLAMQALNTTIGGAVGGELQDFNKTYDELITKQQDLQTEIDKYTALNGQAVGPASDLADVQNRQALAALEYQQAIQAVADAEGAEVTNAQFHYAAQEVFTQKTLEAKIALEQKKQALDDASGALDIADGGVADYSGKLRDLNDDMKVTTDAIKAEEEAHTLATNKIIFNMLAQKVQSEITKEGFTGDVDLINAAMLDTAVNMGIIDQATADAQNTIGLAVDKLSTGDVTGFTDSLYEVAKPLNEDIPLSFENTDKVIEESMTNAAKNLDDGITTSVETLNDKLKDDLVSSTGAAGKAVDELGTHFEKQYKEGGQLYSMNIGVQSLTGSVSRLSAEIRNVPALPGVTAGGGGGAPVNTEDPKAKGAHGLEMDVPAGYPNDSYTIGVQSGEHVSVTPAGQTPSGGGVNIGVIQIYGIRNGKQLVDELERELRARGRTLGTAR